MHFSSSILSLNPGSAMVLVTGLCSQVLHIHMRVVLNPEHYQSLRVFAPHSERSESCGAVANGQWSRPIQIWVCLAHILER